MSINSNGLIHFAQVSKEAGLRKMVSRALVTAVNSGLAAEDQGAMHACGVLSIVETMLKFLSVSA